MTRTVALGAVIGFAVTVLALALWERSGSTASSSVDAGVEGLFVNPKLERGLLAVPGDRRVQKVILAPLPSADADAGSP